MIVRTPAAASASMSARSSLPATLTPGANANSWADMAVLRNDLRAASQPPAAPSPKKSAGKKSAGKKSAEKNQAANCGGR
jgi:hypothetical protein